MDSSKSETRPPLMLHHRTLWLLFAGCLVSMAVYLGMSAATYRTGFPLDDAWIHQTYARNLAERFEWSFVEGQPSGGSTSPLWTVLLAMGHVLGLGPYLWTYLLGFVFLLGLAVVGEAAHRQMDREGRSKIPWVGLLIAFEWHLVWAAGSGMETLAIAFLFTLVLVLIQSGRASWPVLGLLAGVSVWLRPDGLTLLGPLVFAIAALDLERNRKAANLGLALGGFLIAFIPYQIFTKALTGSWWPNTFYAKQAEYAILREQSLLLRLVDEFRLPLIGVGALLLVGFLWFAWSRSKRRDWSSIAGLLWWLGYTGLYAWRLPVTYQYGRYIMPAMPLFFIFGVIGLMDLMRRMKRKPRLRLAAAAWGISTVLITGIFWARGAIAYANDVAIIESEMVNPARWIAVNTQVTDRIAAHDIGAVGYFGRRDLIDLAGLISPEVIPIIRDEVGLQLFLDQKEVDYLIVTFNWYPYLSQQGSLVFESEGAYVPDAADNHTKIYRWRNP